DQALVLDRARMHNGSVPNRAPGADDGVEVVGKMDHRVVLDVAPLADHDPSNVATENRAIKHAAALAQRHIADHGRVGRHPEGAGGVRGAAQMTGKAFLYGHDKVGSRPCPPPTQARPRLPFQTPWSNSPTSDAACSVWSPSSASR